MERRIHYVFIDLGYLSERYRGFAGKWFENEGGIDFHALYRGAHGPPKTFYYDFRESRDAAGDQVLARIRSAPGAHLRTGESGAGPKGVAVQLAVDMLHHGTRGKMTHATLLSGDAGFAPLVRSLVECGTDVTVWAEPAAVAESLRFAADNFLPIRWQDFHHWTDERIGATALLPGIGKSVASRLEGSRESFTRNGWTLLGSGTVGEAGRRADLWQLDSPEAKEFSLAVEHPESPEAVETVSHSDRALLMRYADMEWGAVSLAPPRT
jgi:hypothetical protein